MIYFPETWYQVLGELPDEQVGGLLKDILGYIFERKVPEKKSAAFLLMKHEFDNSSVSKLAIVECDEREALKANDKLINHCITQYKLSKTQLLDYIDTFCDEQEATGKRHVNAADCNKHFFNWLNVKLNKKDGVDKQSQAITTWNDTINQQAAAMFATGGAGGA